MAICPQCQCKFWKKAKEQVCCSMKCRTAKAAAGTVDRFWSKVRKTDECWEWTGHTASGYGRLPLTERKAIGAHRFSWELHYGEIPEGLFVCHHCDNRRCVRPDHLFLGTVKDNSVDMAHKGRSVKGRKFPGRLSGVSLPGNSPKGEANGKALLTVEMVRYIRSRFANGCTKAQIAREVCVSATTISSVLSGRTWGHVK